MDLITLLYILGIGSSLAWGNDVKPAAPEDLDGSGDDEEDFSGSGMESVLVEVSPTQVSPLAPTVTQISTAQQPDIAIEEESHVENATQPHDLDLFDFHPVGKEPFAEEGTTLDPTTHQMATVESDVKKHHHHHHTTTPGTSIPAEVVLVDTTAGPAEVVLVDTTAGPTEVEKPFVATKETTTSTPDGGDIHLVQEVAPTTEDSVQPVDHSETTSGLTSTAYAENEETTAGLADIGEIPGFVDSVEKTTVTDEEHARKHHHHHHHHTTTTATTTTAILLDESDILIEKTTQQSDHLEPEEDQNQQGEATTTPTSEDKHHGHGHHHHKHHHRHTTTPGATQSTASEQDIVHTKEPKGRRVNIPPAEMTTAVPVLPEDEEPVGSTVRYNHTVGPVLDEDIPDSSEEESGAGPVETVDDLFFEVTASVDKSDKMAPAPGDGSAGASHGIMERKELLAGIIAGGLAGLVFAASLVAFVFYRMKKKDEGSYSLEEPKQSNGGYQKPREQREFYA